MIDLIQTFLGPKQLSLSGGSVVQVTIVDVRMDIDGHVLVLYDSGGTVYNWEQVISVKPSGARRLKRE